MRTLGFNGVQAATTDFSHPHHLLQTASYPSLAPIKLISEKETRRQVTLASRMEAQPSIPENVTYLPWISIGTSGAAFTVSDSAVIKVPLPIDNSKEQLAIERRIYDHLGPHPYITELLCTHEGMIVLERL